VYRGSQALEEWHAAMSLSHLWQQQGKRDAARELLAPIYSWSTEGFVTADLQDARELTAFVHAPPSVGGKSSNSSSAWRICRRRG
jgi:predicted ATPase